MTIDVSVLIGIIGCLVGVAGWLFNRDKHTAVDAHWRGSVDAKLDLIVGIRSDVSRLDSTVTAHSERIAKVESSAAQAHHRIDEIVGDKK
ncbi:hypothetical protein [Caproicibacterium sp. XB1]|uniref:hypothetical protein n=1 Tax=Caproicibacterium sp. XB1 TaxID=3396405 RepID=UPI0039B6F6F9